jgi:hypothetical protein
MANKNGLFSRIFKRKPGGTMVGNLIRGVAKGYTGGLLGTGAMRLQEGELPQENNAKVMSQLGAGAIAFNEAGLMGQMPFDPNKSPADNMESGAIFQYIKNKLGYIVGGIVGLVLILVLLLRGKK